MSTEDDTAEEKTAGPVTRDELRSRLLKTRKPNSKLIEFFGEKVEIRQPTLGQILALRESIGGDMQSAVLRTLIEQTYIPGTNTLIFESSDIDQLKELPFGPDMVKISNAIGELAEVNFPIGEMSLKEPQ